MYKLPANTEVQRPLPKSAIYKKYNVYAGLQRHIDSYIGKITISNMIDTYKVPALSDDPDMKRISVMTLETKQQVADKAILFALQKLIPQTMVFALHYLRQTCFAVIHNGNLFCSQWQNDDEAELPLRGSSIREVWENLVKFIGRIEIQGSNSLDEQINLNARRKKIEAEIERLEK